MGFISSSSIFIIINESIYAISSFIYTHTKEATTVLLLGNNFNAPEKFKHSLKTETNHKAKILIYQK